MNPVDPARRSWKRWQKALLGSVIWAALIIGAGIVFTDVILAGKLTKAEDSAISENDGQVFAVGLVGIWAALYSRKSRKE